MRTTEKLTVTIPEFAKLAGISKNQAYLLAANDALGVPVLKFGRRLVLPRRAVMRLLEGDNIGEIDIGKRPENGTDPERSRHNSQMC